VVRNYGSSRCRSDSLQIVRRELACPSIGNNVESDLLSLVEGTHASAFDRADVHENILAAVVRLDKAEALLIVEELHGSSRHITHLSDIGVMRPHIRAAGRFEIWRRSLVRRGMCGEAKSFGRSSVPLYGASQCDRKESREKTGYLAGQPHLILAYRIPISLLSAARGIGLTLITDIDWVVRGARTGYSRVQVTPCTKKTAGAKARAGRDSNIDQALHVLKKKMQPEGVFREMMKRQRTCEKLSEQVTREPRRAHCARRHETD
jgi:ribosomal protein S21